MRDIVPKVVLLAFLPILAISGCRIIVPRGPATADDLATPQDRALADRFEELARTLPQPRIQEIVNLFNETDPAALRWSGLSSNNIGPMALLRLKGEMPATPEHLEQGRKAIGMMLEKFEIIRTNAPSQATIGRCQGSIVIDGKTDEPAWQAATTLPIAYCYRPWKTRPGSPSYVRLLWDDANLYACFDVVDTDIAARQFERDDLAFLWDAVELFLVGDLNLGLYWEICLTPTGGITDRWMYKYPRNWFGHATTSRNMVGMQRAITINGTLDNRQDTDEGYTIEIAIPFAEIPGLRTPVSAGTTLYGLFGVADLTGEAVVANVEYYSNAFSPVGFQDIWSFSTLVLAQDSGNEK